MSTEQELRSRLAEFADAWNKHDTAHLGSFWSMNGDLINPFGRKAEGRAQVEQLFRDEHAGFMSLTSYRVLGSWLRELRSDLAVLDWDAEISGMRSPQGDKLPAFKHHVAAVMERRDDKWWVVAARPYAFAELPSGR